MAWFFVVLVVALAIAPLLQFAPSQRKREQARMREAAALAGLFVEFRDLPGGAALPAAERQVLFYGARLPAVRHRRKTLSWLWREGNWQGLGEARGTAGILPPTPPAEVLAASLDDAACGFYWREEGGPERAGEVISAVLAWRLTVSGEAGDAA